MLTESSRWHAVLARDRAYDATFVYAVRSTGVYCRPSCPSRRPRRDQVQFFDMPALAEQAGFRACRRCHPNGDQPADPNIELVQRICQRLADPHSPVPTLDELAQEFHLSPAHLQRVFKRIVGVSPRQYADEQRRQRFRQQLRDGEEVTRALYEAGYGSSSAVYGQATEQLGMTPATYRAGGMHIDITYTIAESPLGYVLVAATERGICAVRLGDSADELEQTLHGEFSAATLRRDDAELHGWVQQLLDYLHTGQPLGDLPLDVQATAFQRKVWEALRAIPFGSTRTYRQVAEAIGQPTAVRAVARACATNPVALVVPCHRVISSDGGLAGYRWGIERKRALLAHEAERTAG